MKHEMKRLARKTLLRILTNTRQLCDRIDMTLVSLASNYL
ncbi:unnamed protein product, partial [Rotaria sp. Silwood2]